MIDLSEETEALARRLAAARRVTVDVLIRGALETDARIVGTARLPGQNRAARRARISAIAREIAVMPVLDPRPAHGIMDDLNAS
jgi:antitoxin VapB